MSPSKRTWRKNACSTLKVWSMLMISKTIRLIFLKYERPLKKRKRSSNPSRTLSKIYKMHALLYSKDVWHWAMTSGKKGLFGLCANWRNISLDKISPNSLMTKKWGIWWTDTKSKGNQQKARKSKLFWPQLQKKLPYKSMIFWVKKRRGNSQLPNKPNFLNSILPN